MTQTVWHVTRVAHAVVIRGCCGLPDVDPAGGPTCNCSDPSQCVCAAQPEGE